MRRAGVVLIGVFVAAALSSATAWAVSDGQYSPARQHCSGAADDSETPDRVEPGCQSFTVNVNDGDGPELFFVGFQQTADGNNVDPSAPVTGADPTGFDPTRQLQLYIGADDNLDTGEHDSSPLISNGPSDGGAIVANYNMSTLDPWSRAVMGGDVSYVLTHPLPLVDFGFGMCADGICLAVTTTERVAYSGGDKHSDPQPVADYSGKQWDPDTCGGPDDTKADCGGHDIRYWHKRDGVRTTEPGVQFFEDPDPQGSPIGPYPLPALYAGTCGVIVGGGDVVGPADTPLTNSAGQAYIPTGCSTGFSRR
jgi:hypothetical protein